MFFSKIWFFLIALAAALALTVALVMPRPAERAHIDNEKQRLVVACTVVDILLGDDARNRVELASAFASKPEIVSALSTASAAASIDESRMKQVRAVGEAVMEEMKGKRKPDFAMLIDTHGRVVARVALDQNDFGDIAAGRPLIDDALAGYLRDDLWAHNGTLYLVTAAPVVKRDAPVSYAGAIVLGHQVTNTLAQRLVKSLDVDLGFYLGKDEVAGSKTLAVEATPMVEAVKAISGGDLSQDCLANKTIPITSGKESYTALVARLPGEVSNRSAYYTVFIKRPDALGFAGTLKVVNQSDLAPGKFPWPLVAGGFLLMLGIGIALMFIESDRPLRKLTAEAVKLAKGETERLSEDAHPGKFGSIARSVNIAIDKLGREAKSAKKDMDQLLGPAPEGSLGTIDLLATALPAVRPGGSAPSMSQPPSEFKFLSSSTQPGVTPATPPPRTPQARPGTPPPMTPTARPPAPPPTPALGTPTPPPPAFAATPTPTPASASDLGLDDDILGGSVPDGSAAVAGDDSFKQVFDQFVAMKKSCGEPTTGLTLAKFSEKLVKNREDLMTKTGCKDVRFTVYVKDGKAALKATPVKED
ncbi:MAG: hypothetical protein JWP01_1064 [Myxococcales bacterium]|nr:hypothetical protein [Myxococcales bacterium]